MSIEKCTEGGIGGWLDVSLKSAPSHPSLGAVCRPEGRVGEEVRDVAS